MWGGENFMRVPGGGQLGSKSAPCSPAKPFQKRAPAQPDSFHVIHKVPLGDSPYVKAKHVQLVDKDPDAAIALFWAAINAGDRVDSALKDMAIVMKQQNRPEEAIEAIKSLRYRCSDAAQESLDNVLLDLYKRCGRLDDQIALLKHKLHLIHQGMAFNGKRTKTARSQGKKFQVSIEQEATRLLGNLGWAYMQQNNFLAAEAVYRKALSIGPDNNKVCNLGICLMKQGRMEEAKAMLQSVVPACPDTRWGSDSHLKSYERAQEMLVELEASMGRSSAVASTFCSSLASNNLLQSALWQPQAAVASHQIATRSAGVKVDSITDFTMPLSGALSATAGFGPTATSRPVEKKMASSLGGQERPNSHDLGGGSNQFMGYHQSSNFNSSWDDYEPGYTSPDENVDTNVQGMANNNNQGLSGAPHFQQQVHWPGAALRHRQESFSAALMESNNENQRLGPRKLERSLTFGGPLQRDTNNANNNNSSSGLGSFAFPQMQRAASENFSGKISSSPTKHNLGERAPLTYDRTNLMNMYTTASEDENGASKQITNGWGAKMTAPPLKSPLGNAELSFFSRWGYNENRYNENRPTVRRSLSLESFDTQLEQIALENEEAEEAMSFPSLQAGIHVKRRRNQTPVKEKSSSSNSTSLWNSLGFTLSPDCQYSNEDMKHMSNLVSHVVTEASAAPAQPENVHIGERQRQHSAATVVAAPASSAASTAEPASDAEMIKRQRRLRVFQEITLFPGSPQQVGV